MTSSARSLLALLPFLLLEQVLVVNLRQNVYSCANIYWNEETRHESCKLVTCWDISIPQLLHLSLKKIHATRTPAVLSPTLPATMGTVVTAPAKLAWSVSHQTADLSVSSTLTVPWNWLAEPRSVLTHALVFVARMQTAEWGTISRSVFAIKATSEILLPVATDPPVSHNSRLPAANLFSFLSNTATSWGHSTLQSFPLWKKCRMQWTTRRCLLSLHQGLHWQPLHWM